MGGVLLVWMTIPVCDPVRYAPSAPLPSQAAAAY